MVEEELKETMHAMLSFNVSFATEKSRIWICEEMIQSVVGVGTAEKISLEF